MGVGDAMGPAVALSDSRAVRSLGNKVKVLDENVRVAETQEVFVIDVQEGSIRSIFNCHGRHPKHARKP